MMVTAHVAVGAAVGVATGNPLLGLAAGIASHFVCDMVPHFDAGSFMAPGKEIYGVREYVWAVADIVVSTGFIVIMARHSSNPAALVAGGIGGALPDITFNTPFWSEWTREIPGFKWLHHRIHENMHWTAPAPDWLAGTITQLVAIGGALWFLGF